MVHGSRRKFLQSSLALAGISLLPSYRVLSAGATQPLAKVPHIGVLFPSPPASARSPNIDAFLQGMREHGYVEGQTAAIEWRFAEKDPMYRDLAVELVQLKVDVIVTA